MRSNNDLREFNRDLQEKVKLFDGSAEAELEQKRIDAEYEMDEMREARRLRRNALAETYRGEARKHGLLPSVAAMTPGERKNYSVSRLLKFMASGDKTDCLEKDLGRSIAEDLKTLATPACAVGNHGGFLIPLRLGISASGLNTRTDSAGGYFVGDQKREIFDYLRDATAVLRLGATFLPGFKAASFPMETGVVQSHWISENPGVDVSESDPTVGLASPSPRTLMATTSYSREILVQASTDLENWIRARLALAHGSALDYGALHGSGFEGEPAGILTRDGITVVTTGGTCTAAHIAELEESVPNADPAGACGFLTNSKMRKKLRATASLASGTEPVWGDAGLLGYMSLVSNQVRGDLGATADASAIVFAQWDQVLLVEFLGAIEIIVDPYAQKKRGMVEVSSYQAVDVVLPNARAVSAILDAK